MSDKYDKLRREAESDCKDYGGTICLERSYVKAILDDLAAATARAEALDIANQHATQEARRLRVEVDQLNEAATRPDLVAARAEAAEGQFKMVVGRDDLKTLVELRACARAWDPEACLLGNNRAGDIAKAIDAVLDAVAAASRPPAAADVEGLQKRLADGLMPPVQGEGMTFDQAAITDRYRELRGKLSFTKALGQARVEFVARVLSELTERRPAAIADGNRLDWIEANRIDLRWSEGAGCGAFSPDSSPSWASDDFPTAREAIDQGIGDYAYYAAHQHPDSRPDAAGEST